MGLVNNGNGQANQPIRVNNLHCPGGDRGHKLGQVHENWQTPVQSNGKYRKSSHTLNKLLQGIAPPAPIECSLNSSSLKLFLQPSLLNSSLSSLLSSKKSFKFKFLALFETLFEALFEALFKTLYKALFKALIEAFFKAFLRYLLRSLLSSLLGSLLRSLLGYKGYYKGPHFYSRCIEE